MSRHPRDLHAFSLGDLTGPDEAAIARHVATCRRCRGEVRRLREEHATTLDALPKVVPSPTAREQALAAARAAMAESGAAHAADGASMASLAAGSRRPGSAARLRRLAPAWAAWALTGAIAVAAVGISVERHAAWRASEAERALVAGWLTRQDVTTWALPAAPGARSPGSVMVADDGVVLVVMRAPAPGGSAYRAWGVGPDGATPLGDVPRTVLRAPAAEYHEVVVSLEPSRASAEPTEPLGAAPIRHDRPAP